MATDKLVDFDHVTDYISREAAILAIKRRENENKHWAGYPETLDLCTDLSDAIDAIKNVRCAFRTVVKAKGTEVELHDVSDHDFVEVVRYKDCKEFQANHHWCGFLKTDIDPDGFCSYGEKRAGNGTP